MLGLGSNRHNPSTRTLPLQNKKGKLAGNNELSLLHYAPYSIWDMTWIMVSEFSDIRLWLGIVISVILSVLAALNTPALQALSWIALLPAVVGFLWSRQLRLQQIIGQHESQLAQHVGQAKTQSSEMETVSSALTEANEALRRQVENLTALRDVTLAMGSTLDRQSLLNNVIEVTTILLRFDRAMVLVVDPEKEALTFGAISHPVGSPEDQFRLEKIEIPLSATEEFPLITAWSQGRSVMVKPGERPFSARYAWMFDVMEMEHFFSVPLYLAGTLNGVVVVDNRFTQEPISEEARSLLEALAANIVIALENARLYHLTDEQLNSHVGELDMMRQVDRELNEALSWDRVRNMTLDWALRLTGAHSASLAMVNPDANELRIVATYGPDVPDAEVIPLNEGIMGRVASTGYPLIIGDVTQDPDYSSYSQNTKSYLATPIRRRDRVIGVINLESPHLNSFTPEHLDFAERLANRASVALENARLFEETQREREKLSSILEKTTDIIIVVGFDQRLVLINEAALAAFRLQPHDAYAGREFKDVFAYTPLEGLYGRLFEREKHLPFMEEIVLEDGQRYFHTNAAPNEQVGWVIVLHDVTPFKETEQLKNELIATVSHDLKNPLSVINGYVELLGIYNELNERGEEFMRMIRRSIRAMRDLIDDLLDLAHIDAGLELSPEPVSLHPIIEDSVMGLINLAEEKKLKVEVNVPPDLPSVHGDDRRLRQVLNNLISNAIKYTPPEGQIIVRAESRGDSVMISVEDDGMGISPEDQAQIFERFYRVRRPETDGIEGTGLGLAIVKSLIEAHGGELGLESHLGEGSTFYFTIPYAPTPVPSS